MTPTREETIERLERQKARLVRPIKTWPHEWLTYKPTPASWSALDVLDHLRKTELAVFQSCEHNLKSSNQTVTLRERARGILFLAIMRLPVRVRVPDPVSFVLPGRVTSLQTVLDSWSAQRALLKAFLGAMGTANENVGVTFHPAVGWMNLRGAMSFLSVHIRHHEYQLRRIKKHIEAAGSSGFIKRA
jgi:DinB superfamily